MVSYPRYVTLFLALLAVSVAANLSPGLSPTLDEICNEVNCGKGTCETARGSLFGFKCKCENGWSRTGSNQEDDLDFLPCIIPNCSLDYSCLPAAPPTPTPSIPTNISVFDPCYWTYCGEGTCKQNLTYGQTCQCKPGYSNLLNITSFPCFSECALGSDCERLGINVSISTSPSDDTNQDEICSEVNCGKGTCETARSSLFGFKCKCENGWFRTRSNQEDDLDFLPCIIPNCSLDYSCLSAAPPIPSIPTNISVFDPCYWTYCGEGTCKKNLTYGQTCQCKPGYSNLLNITAFPCFSECALGSDCERLGINVSRSTVSSDDNNQATSFLPGNSHWIAIVLISVLLAVRN
ncbi:hypothetical protein POM88_030334 [Heracleum sosnowskyi]|uniref:EGF-like domain-containing protein n=1 Tax=Heracleum sosnowskyi TaxID=360622 RepID=A0AAD8HWR9_9APIA|nr:hypothetical protein POM88_030334 [Heracleum sosnowskyi]